MRLHKEFKRVKSNSCISLHLDVRSTGPANKSDFNDAGVGEIDFIYSYKREA